MMEVSVHLRDSSSHLGPPEPGTLPDNQGAEPVTGETGPGTRQLRLQDILPPWPTKREG